MVYLDYAATCPVVKYPQQLYRDVLGEGYFLNPNANYAYKEKRLLAEVENRVKKAIGAKGGKVIFGGTSSQLIENLMNAVTEETYFYQVLCSNCEHDSCFRFRNGLVNTTILLDKLLESYRLNPEEHDYDSVFVMWQGVNNITGEIFPVEEIGNICHKYEKYNAFYICDATALLGHTVIESNIDDWCDFLVLDGHKIGTEVGIGCCWVSDRLDKWLDGFKLHGTPNLAGALAMTQAVEDACDSRRLGLNSIHYGELLDHLIDGLIEKDIDFQLVPEYEDNEPSDKFTLAINAIRLPGFNADALQQFLASKQVYVSIGGSACAEKHDYRVLNAYGLSNDEASEVIRVSFGENSTVEDVEALVEQIKNFKELYLK